MTAHSPAKHAAAAAVPVQWLTPAEVAVIARRSKHTVWVALRTGQLHGHRKCRRGAWTIHPDSVTAWIEADDPAVAAIASARVCSCGKVRILRPA